MLGDLPNNDIRPLVIFGAGASHDLVNDDDYPAFDGSLQQPPLANSMFGTNDWLTNIQREFDEIQGLIGIVKQRMKKTDLYGKKKSFEEVLDEIEQTANNTTLVDDMPHLIRYIAKLFYEISYYNSEKYSGNNYATFFQLMADACKKHYFVVNFNYDYLAQRAIEGLLKKLFTDINSYINHSIKLIHVHGSVLWRSVVSEEWVVDNHKVLNPDKYNYNKPIIAAPTEKLKKFVCPEYHIELLRSYMKEVNAVIMIGWKGTEEHFKDEILSFIETPPHRIIIVGGKKDETAEILSNSGLERFRCSTYYINGFSNLLSAYSDFSVRPSEKHRGRRWTSSV